MSASPLRLAGALLAPLVASGCAIAPRASAEVAGPPVQAELEALVQGFEGTVGIYARRLSTGEEAAVRAEETFPTASLVKLPILLALYERIEAGELDPHQQMTYSASRSRGGEDLLAAFTDGAKLPLSKLIHLMIAFSDNTASVWCQALAGGGEGVNAWLAERGYDSTRVNSRTPGRERAYREWGWGQTTPREMAEMLVAIREGQAVSPRADEEMYRVLCRAYWDAEALSQLPPWVQAASKQGALNRSRSEVVLVNAPAGDYVFCVITKDQADTSWGADNAGFVLLRQVSRLLWGRWGGGEPWEPAPGVEAWR
jgi:beta-lactamase class A